MPKRFDQARPFAALAIALAAWLVLPTVVRTFARASFFELTAPVTLAASRVRDLQQYWSLRAHSDRQLIEAGVDLARVTASYEVAAEENASLRAELARLQETLKLPAPEGFRFENCRVCRRDFSAWWQRLAIDKGKQQGIPEGAPVIFAGGLVGKVVEVHAYQSVVELITDPGFRIAAFIEGHPEPLSYQGGHNPPFGSATGVVEYVPITEEIGAKPLRLVTSSLGGTYPDGLLIGEVSKLDPSADGLYRTAQVRIDPRLVELAEVTVLLPAPAAPAAPVP